MTRFLLVRHGAHDLLGRVLAGRMPGVALNAEGRAQAARLAEHLAACQPAALVSSPLQRTRETAEPIARRAGVALQLDEGLQEVDYGDWTGRGFAELEREPGWPLFNSARSLARVPGGESMLEVQDRMVAALRRWADAHPDRAVVVVGHGDPLKSAIAYFLGVPLDLLTRIEIAPGSVSELELEPGGVRVHGLNRVPASPGGT